MSSLRASAIVVVFLLLTLVLLPWQWSGLRFGLPHARTFPHRYHRMLAALLGLKIRVVGAPIRHEGVLIVANHTSWLDIVIFSAIAPISFIAKAEVARWPFFGTLARLQRTVFIERERRTATGQARDVIRVRLLEGDALVLFPEGTSGDGNSVLPFKSALMGAAEAAFSDGRHVRVQPVSVAYVNRHAIPMGRENRPFYAWYGDMALVPHLWGVLIAGPLDVVVEFHPAMSLDAMDRKQLARTAETAVRAGQARALAGTPALGGRPGERAPRTSVRAPVTA